MPYFIYKGRNGAGELVQGQLQAASAEAAATDLYGDDITPVDIRETARQAKNKSDSEESGIERFNAAWSGSKIEIDDLIIFSRQMHSMSKSGIPLDRALRGIEASSASPPLKQMLKDVAGELEKGNALTDAFGKHPRIFSPLFLSLIHVGENTGRLDLSFQQIGVYLELERDTRKQVKSATRYPIFVIVAIAVALAILTIFVIPVFADTFARLDAELPWQTVLLINISDFMVNWWYIVLGVLAGAYIGFRQYISTEQGRLKWDRQKLKFPLIGKIFDRIALSRFARTFAMMMKAGVPIVQSLGVISMAVGNKYIGENIKIMRDGIAKGDSLYRTSVKAGMFSPLVLQMIAVGEESGNVDELLDEVADFYDSEVEYDLKRLSSAIEPILIVFIAGMVLILALGVFLPIWDLASAVR